MKPIRVLIVDDVELARERVRLYLREEKDVQVVGEAASGAEALRDIARLMPDLVFLDVQLPDFDGFEIVRRLPGHARPVVVYVSAHDEKAIEAFEVDALDYLLKPFDHGRFQRALSRARSQLRAAVVSRSPQYLERLAIKERGRTEIVAVHEVDYVDVAGHYLCVHAGKSVHLLRGTLSELEPQLDPAQFARIHRSALVRLERIKSLVARRNGDCDVLLSDGTTLLMSRTYLDSVRARLGLGAT
ncbi:MAG TPA: LytTR family DNA-binding domain-containing protein [Steroidobacteraceae bacterium]|jgi:two-component system LytT family response regulator|nr:LytTR family DNA-binding domain-containing protein [Steroidobacteraceae bacterium]